jgi:hypothetical protein
MEQCRVSADELNHDRRNMAAELNHVNTCIACTESINDKDVKHDEHTVKFWRNVPSRIKHPCICNDCSTVHAVIVKFDLDQL